jgi:hypothetical protein
MKKSMIIAAGLCMVLLAGCGKKAAEGADAVTADTAQSETQAQESVVALVESAPEGAAEPGVPTGTGDPQELRQDKVSAGKLTVDSDMTTYEGEIFSASYYSDDFTADDESAADTVTFYYMGDALHEPYVKFEYIKGADLGELKDEIRLMEGKHELDETDTLSFYSKPMSVFSLEKEADDGLTDYYFYYVFEYGEGCVRITSATYYSDIDPDATTGISDAIAMIFDTMKVRE